MHEVAGRSQKGMQCEVNVAERCKSKVYMQSAEKELFEHFKWRYECTRLDRAYSLRKTVKSRHQRSSVESGVSGLKVLKTLRHLHALFRRVPKSVL